MRLNLVTGATGLLGSHIAEQLRARGERVRALVRPTSDTAFLRPLGVELRHGDLDKRDDLIGAASDCDVVYHCAARVGDWGSWRDFRRQVVGATGHVVAACEKVGVGRLLHVSSISVYGHPPPKPVIREDEPLGQGLRFLEHYARAKILAEELVRPLGTRVTIVRPSWIYGPRDRNGFPRLANTLRYGWAKIQGSGDNPLNIIHAADVGAGAIRAATDPRAGGQAYHLCGRGDITQREFLDVICDGFGLPRVERHVGPRAAFCWGLFGDVVARALRWKRPPYISRYSVGLMARPANFSNEKAQRELGWQPEIAARDGLRATIASFLGS